MVWGGGYFFIDAFWRGQKSFFFFWLIRSKNDERAWGPWMFCIALCVNVTSIWRWKFPMSPHVLWLVGWLDGRLVCHDFFKGVEVVNPCSYRSTCSNVTNIQYFMIDGRVGGYVYDFGDFFLVIGSETFLLTPMSVCLSSGLSVGRSVRISSFTWHASIGELVYI